MKTFFYAVVIALCASVSSAFAAPNSTANFFEIPVADFSRAIAFYEKILDEKLTTKTGPGYSMAFFPAPNGGLAGALTKAENYVPNATGTVVYLDGGDDLQVILDRVASAGGKIAVPKTLVSPEVGYFAQLIDSEGNRVGLYSPTKR